MSNRNAGTVPETEAERALSDYAMSRFKDYKTRWAPLQARLASTINAMGAPGSAEREKLKAASAGDTSVAFDKAATQAAQRDEAMGINRNSSAAKLRQEGLRTDRAASTGIGGAVSDQMIDDAYVGGLQQLMQIGRGQQGVASQGMADTASLAAREAQSDAAIAAENRAGNYNAVGTAIGIGGGAMMRRMRAPSAQGSGIGYGQSGTAAASAYVPDGGGGFVPAI